MKKILALETDDKESSMVFLQSHRDSYCLLPYFSLSHPRIHMYILYIQEVLDIGLGPIVGEYYRYLTILESKCERDRISRQQYYYNCQGIITCVPSHDLENVSEKNVLALAEKKILFCFGSIDVKSFEVWYVSSCVFSYILVFGARFF